MTEYQGTKSIVFTTKSVIGGKNPFLGIAYVVVGGICIVLGAIFTVTHLIRPRYAHLFKKNVPKLLILQLLENSVTIHISHGTRSRTMRPSRVRVVHLWVCPQVAIWLRTLEVHHHLETRHVL